MNWEKHGRGVEQAREMIAVFGSLGVRAFDLTETDLDGQKQGFRRAQGVAELLDCLPRWMGAVTTQQHNLIVRPHAATAMLAQLDDLHEAALWRVRDTSFLVLRTSPGNHQAWVAIADHDPDIVRTLRRGAGADPSASGAARIAGSINFKRKYAPDFPLVTLLKASPRLTTRAELAALGLVALPVSHVALPTPRRRVSDGSTPSWPSYERCVLNSPRAHGAERPDISRADFTFCLLAIDWGRSTEETAERLMQLSRKARDNGEAYAWRTARAAAAAVARRHQ